MIRLIKKKIKNYFLRKKEEKHMGIIKTLKDPKIGVNEKWLLLHCSKEDLTHTEYLKWDIHLKSLEK